MKHRVNTLIEIDPLFVWYCVDKGLFTLSEKANKKLNKELSLRKIYQKEELTKWESLGVD